MLRFPLAILVVFVHGFGADIDVSELHASGLTGLAVYDYALPPFILGYVISAFNKMSIIGDKVFPMSDSWYMMTFNYLATPFVCILLCIAIYWFLQKYLPSFLEVIVGERKK
jgi:hypothetical protein